MPTPPVPYPGGEIEVHSPPRGQYRVLKFGGSSLGSVQRLAQVALLVISEANAGAANAAREGGGPSRFAVVVSAPGDTTDWLIDAADYAAAGRLADAGATVDKILETATRNCRAAYRQSIAPLGKDTPGGTGVAEHLTEPSKGTAKALHCRAEPLNGEAENLTSVAAPIKGAAASLGGAAEPVSRPTKSLIGAAEALHSAAEHLDGAAEALCSAAGPLNGAADSLNGAAEPFDADSRVEEELAKAAQELLGPLRQLLLGISLLREKTPQALDAVLSFGERLSVLILKTLLEAAGLPVVGVDARSWVTTDASFGKAKVDWPTSRRKLLALWPEWGGAVAVITGFIGSTSDGRTTTLGRNGSDFTATMLGAALAAESVAINTDSYGVMTADPAIVSNAFPVTLLTYREALDLALYGARIFHARTMLPLIESGVPMTIRNTADPTGPCTTIRAAHGGGDSGCCDTAEAVATTNGQPPAGGAGSPGNGFTGGNGGAGGNGQQATCVTSLERLGMLELRSRTLEEGSSLTGRVFKALEHRKLTVYMGSQAAHGHSVAAILPEAEVEVAREALSAEFRQEFSDGDLDPLPAVERVSMLSLVAEGLRAAPGIAARFFGALSAAQVHVLANAAGPRSLSVAVAAEDTVRAVRAVHDAFNLAHAGSAAASGSNSDRNAGHN